MHTSIAIKRLFYIIPCIALGLLACACADDEACVPDVHDDTSLTVFVAGNHNTRMTIEDRMETSPGEEDMNENLISTLDFFFYALDDDMTAAAKYHIFETANVQDEWTMTKALSIESLKQIFGPTLTDGIYCTVYIVANYGDGTASSFTGAESREDLKQKPVAADFGANKKQDKFVMEGTATAKLTSGSRWTLVGEIPLRRTAAKVRLAVAIDDNALTGVKDGNGFIWEPQPQTLQVMMEHGVNKGIVSTTTNDYRYTYPDADAPIYFPTGEEANVWDTYGRSMDVTEEIEGRTWYKHEIPFYSYTTKNWATQPDNEAYLTLMMQWKRQGTEKFENTYYQIPMPIRAGDDHFLKSYRYYMMNVILGVIGSFKVEEPVELKDNSYIIVDWGVNSTVNVDTEFEVTMSDVAYLAVQFNTDTLNNVSSHGVSYVSSHDATAEFTKMEFYSFFDTNTTDRFLRVIYERYTYGSSYRWRRNVYDGVTGNLVSGTNYTSQNVSNPFTNSGEYKGFPLGGYSVNTDNDMVTLEHEIPSEQFSLVNVTVRVTNEKGYSDEIVFTQFPAIYITAHQSNGFAFVNNYGSGAAPAYDNGTNITRESIGSVNNRASVTGQGSNKNRNLYTVHISSFADDTYILGDPRTGQAVALTNIPTNNYWPTQSNYPNNYPLSQNAAHDETENMIAPEFMIASSYGVISSSYYMTYDRAKKRCAAYQEDGYPAGRWRMPTAAEVKYMMTLHADEKIPSMFNLRKNDGEGYWCGNGKISGDVNAHPYLSNNTDNTAVRCVYDTWYWGEEPYNNTHYNTWLGYHD